MKKNTGKSRERKTAVYDPSSRLLSQEMFWTLLDRERALADRANRSFALLVFVLNSRDDEDATMEMLINAVHSRMRLTDAVGWLDDGQLAALLANTDGECARSIANAICSVVGQTGERPTCEVYAYPLKPETPSHDNAIRNKVGGNVDHGESAPHSVASMTSMHELLTIAVPRWKRFFDVVISGAALLLISPLFLALAIYIKRVSPGPVLFTQPRIGRACRSFNCLKFRTMHVNSDSSVHKRHMSNFIAQTDLPMTKLESGTDDRLIPFAKYIRAAGLDELPQLINVLRGEMSLVGPRPCLEYEFRDFSPWQRRRFDTLPGLTGLWQVNGKNQTSFMQMMRYDVCYTTRLSFAHDRRILWRTMPAMIAQVKAIRRTRKSTL